jgi:hypothetical protein
MKKYFLFAAKLSSVALISLVLILPTAHAEEKAKVDCAQVMSELNTGKAPNGVAEKLKLPMAEVLKCRRKGQREAQLAARKAAARRLLGISSPTASSSATPSPTASSSATPSPTASPSK